MLVAAAQDFNLASDWEAAGALLRRAVTLAPNSPDANTWYAFHLALVGRCKEGEHFARRAVARDPQSKWRMPAIPRLLQCAGNTASALQEYQRLLREDSANSSLAYGAYLAALSSGADDRRRFASFLHTALREDGPSSAITSMIDRARAAADSKEGNPAALERKVDADFKAALENRKPASAGTEGYTMFALAYEYASAGLTDKAFETLTRAHDAGSTYLPWALPFGAREFPEPMRSDARYRALWQNPSVWAALMHRRAAGGAGRSPQPPTTLTTPG